jgi:hypothetical protein
MMINNVTTHQKPFMWNMFGNPCCPEVWDFIPPPPPIPVLGRWQPDFNLGIKKNLRQLYGGKREFPKEEYGTYNCCEKKAICSSALYCCLKYHTMTTYREVQIQLHNILNLTARWTCAIKL